MANGIVAFQTKPVKNSGNIPGMVLYLMMNFFCGQNLLDIAERKAKAVPKKVLGFPAKKSIFSLIEDC